MVLGEVVEQAHAASTIQGGDMSWLELFFLVLVLNLGLTAIVIVFHRSNQGPSPWWEANSLVAVTLFALMAVARVGADVFGFSLRNGAMALQAFFWGGLLSFVMLYCLGVVRQETRALMRRVATVNDDYEAS